MPSDDMGLDLDLDLDLNLDLSLSMETDEAVESTIDESKCTGDAEVDSAMEMSELKRGFIARAKAEEKRRASATDSEYWCCICFQSREQVEAFLRQTKWAEPDQKYLDGQKIARKLNIALPPAQLLRRSRATGAKLVNMAMEV